ncbi:MAG: RNA polymerase factor sigma-54 [Spirochaetota bacterium]|nr:RNA polymerase factor sigma-54 [Spirochaetota bacterium]
MKNVSIGLQQTQKLIISPQLQQAIKLLQLSNIELVEKIESELAENPFLEEVEDYKDERKNGSDDNLQSNNEINDFGNKSLEFDFNKRQINIDNVSEENFFEDSSDFGYVKKSISKSDGASKQQYLENAFAIETTLSDHLLSQLKLTNVNDEEFLIGEMIISCLDENGYFGISLAEIAESAKCSIEDAERILKVIQSFDPPGIGGRDLKEVILIQMDQLDTKNKLAEEIVRNYLSYVEKNKYKEIATKCGANSIDDIKKAIKFISQFEPIPARQFDNGKINYVIPDVSVHKVDDGFIISFNEGIIPNIRVNKSYHEILQSEKLDDQTKTYFNNQYSEAKLLIFSLKKRKSTISKVVEQLVEYQKVFFERGSQHLKPLILRDIADKIGMHESTISRVTTNKYIETPWGIFSLKYFFSSGIRKSSGEMKSSQSVKEIIKEIIINEHDDNALSDNKIVKILSNRGINIARRTVAKYRNSLKILPSFRRKEN